MIVFKKQIAFRLYKHEWINRKHQMSRCEQRLNGWRNVEHHDAIGSIKYSADRCLTCILMQFTLLLLHSHLPRYGSTYLYLNSMAHNAFWGAKKLAASHALMSWHWIEYGNYCFLITVCILALNVILLKLNWIRFFFLASKGSI